MQKSSLKEIKMAQLKELLFGVDLTIRFEEFRVSLFPGSDSPLQTNMDIPPGIDIALQLFAIDIKLGDGMIKAKIALKNIGAYEYDD